MTDTLINELQETAGHSREAEAARTRPIHVMIVDDHAMVRDGLSALIAQAPDMKLVGAAGDGRKALEEAAICQPDVIVMDLRLPEMDGVATTRVIHERTRKSKILMLSTFDREEEIYRSLQAGASGFLLKGASRQELLDGIRQVASGQTVLSQQAAEKLAEHVRYSRLTPREHEVLSGVVAGKSNNEIATDLYISEGTVKAHINRILGKLQVTHRTQAATTALRRGLVDLD